MSGKKNKKPFGEEEDKEDIGFRVPTHHDDPETEEEAAAEDAGVKDEDEEDDDAEEENFDEEGSGWHTFDLDNPDETL